ncbi:hypothetical protein N9X53_06325 [Mariniblastus sp.]|nr:hypothetical protein [Mariniblastus sp.]
MSLDIVMNTYPIFEIDRLSPEADARSDWVLRTSKLILLVSIAFGLFLCMPIQGNAEEGVRCKYSVRDVAFVNVHGKSWQLRLVKPVGVTPERFEKWNVALRNQLADSNVGYAWYDAESDIGKQIQLANPDAAQMPLMDLVRSGADGSPLAVPSSPQLEEGLRLLVQSPTRDEIFSKLVDDLCVFVLVQSGVESKDAGAKSELMAAVKRVNDQMWTLEKPTDSGPSLVVVPESRRSAEKWLLSSLGITDHSQPAVAVLYGQGRLLGKVLSGDEITVDAIVARASICGQDCECSLNRNWLYGVQVLHRWDKTLERKAEESLDFDPNSAFVIAEVAQILQKNAGQITQAPPVMLGGGLVIHDLADLDPDSNLEADAAEATEAKTVDADLAVGEVSEESVESDVGENETSKALSEDDRKSVIAMPWAILIFFSGLVVVGAFWLFSRS